MGRKKTKAERSMMKNNASYLHYFYQLKELAITTFEWKNLPDSIDERFLELILFEEGKVLFFNDDVLGYLALQSTTSGNLDVYRIPIDRHAIAVNGYQANRDKNNSVLIFNNNLRTPSRFDVEFYSEKLWRIDRIIDVNVNAQKTPVLVRASDTQRLTLLNVYEQYDGNEPVIFGDKNLDPKDILAIRTDAPYVSDKLYNLKIQYWNEALTALGIENVNFQKRERLISGEVERQQGGIIANRNTRLSARQRACEQINKMFGLDIWCDFRNDSDELDEEENEEFTEDAENG